MEGEAVESWEDEPLMETRLWIDGRWVKADEPATLAIVNYGHFTAMQVRDGRVRGLDVHLSRVDDAHRELFGHGLDRGWIRGQWADAVRENPNASLRATFYDGPAGEKHVVIVVRAPVEPANAPQRLRSVHYVRPFAHLKHVGTFAQIRHGEQAEQAGYDDALLVDEERYVAETTMANIGFCREDRLIWPAGPALHGIGQQLLSDSALQAGLGVEFAAVSLDELDIFDGAFTINSVGVVAVEQIDAHHFASASDHVNPFIEMHECLGWDDLAY